MKKLLELPYIGSAIRMLIYLTVVMLTYLFQVSVMPYFKINGISPNLLVITISVIAVGFGRLRSFWTGAIFGILLEVMTPTVTLLNMAFYTVASFIAFIFTDKTQQQLDYRRSQGRSGYNMNPLLRTALCCLLLIVLYNVVNMLKIYLSGYEVTVIHISRSLLSVVLTEVFCLILMMPLRLFMGLHYVPLKKEKALRYENM